MPNSWAKSDPKLRWLEVDRDKVLTSNHQELREREPLSHFNIYLFQFILQNQVFYGS